jgi:di/tricarboxylate transporter
MNNVGALALLMPVALQAAAKAGWAPGRMLMPLAFGSILGGMTTLIGTPPNLIVSAFRDEAAGGAFSMFAFAPVGVPVALAGVLFISLVGWRLVPARERAGVEGFDAGAYFTEARVPEESRIDGMTLGEIEERLEHAQVIGLVRREVRLRAPRASTRVRGGDILVIEAEPEALAAALTALGLKLEEDVDPEAASEDGDAEAAERAPAGGREGETAEGRRARGRRGGASRGQRAAPRGRGDDARGAGGAADRRADRPLGDRARAARALPREHAGALAAGQARDRRLKRVRFAAGDVLLMQGAPEAIAGFAADNGCLPLAERPLRLPDRRRMLLAVGIFLAAVAVAASGLAPAAVAFAGGVLAAWSPASCRRARSTPRSTGR